ncbi:MAG: hypothetical protein IT353_04935 [Gemmatimonadaceae bacterium]|nr:hypothetical protein [Gemmatimonadaceae bacterium]
MRALWSVVCAVVGTALVACSGGEKIVSPGGTVGSNSRLGAADSSYMAGVLSSASFDLMKNLRRMPSTTAVGVQQNAPSCTPSIVTGGPDANLNGIPDDRTAQYSATSCAYTQSGYNYTVAGGVRIQDLNSIRGYRVTYTGYTVTGTKGDSVVRTVLNGTLEYSWATALTATANDNTTVLIEVRSTNGSASLTRVANLTALFTPNAGSTISANQILPSGTLAVSGALTMTGVATGNQVVAGVPSTQTLALNVSTVTQLVNSSSCSSDASFSVGALAATVTGSNTGDIAVRFSGCGQGTTTPPNVTPPGKR